MSIKYQEYIIYLINSIISGVIASQVVTDMTLNNSIHFAAIALGCFIFINKIFLRIFRFHMGKTVKQQLETTCPRNSRANGMINIGNLATYDDYLFSACKKAGTCNDYDPDIISQGIINKKEHCGAWDLKSTGLSYSPVKGWSKEADCNKYNGQSSFLPDKCLKQLWEASKCTNIEAADKQYLIWKKQNKAAIVKDLNSWKNLTDNTHRTLCYGKDKGRWPQNPCNTDSVVKIKAVELGTVGIAPWGACPGFLSQTAKWIGPNSGSATTAPPGVNGYYIYEYLNEDESAINATLNVIADDSCTIDVNNQMIGTQNGGWGGKGGIFKVTIKPGLNRFLFRLFNAGQSPNPTALLAVVMNGNTVLFQTDASWSYSMSYPCSGRNEDDNIDCNRFTDEDINLPAKCQRQMWKEVGCLTPQNGSNNWWYERKKSVVRADMKAWATMTDDDHRTGCYGPDRSRWPETIPTDGFCKSKNPGTAVVKAVKTKCRVAGCNDALGGPGWIDFCNAGHAEYTCCGTNNTTQTKPVKFSVGYATGPYRNMMNNQGRDMNYAGWSLLLNFYAYKDSYPGTKKYSVGHAFNPHRIWIIEDGRDLNFGGWTHLFNFYAFPSPKPGTIKMSVGYAKMPWRIWLSVNNPRNMNHDGWTNLTTFYAYPNDNF